MAAFPKDLGNVESIVYALMSVLGIVLMLTTYMYIQKLERIQCACSEHPYRNYIKNYILFAIVFLLFTMFVTPAQAVKMFGTTFGLVYSVAQVIYGFATFIFFVYALQYVRYLMREKCKCSEDVRREVLYVWSIAEIVIIGVLVILPLLSQVVLSSLGVVMSATKELVTKEPSAMREAAVNPLKSLKKLPASLKKTGKAFRK